MNEQPLQEQPSVTPYTAPEPTSQQPAPLAPVEPLQAAPIAPARKSRRAVILVIVAVLLIAAAVVGYFLTRPAPVKTAASTAPTAVQTNDLQSDMAGASASMDQSQSDQQSTDNSINDSGSQVAVPTE